MESLSQNLSIKGDKVNFYSSGTLGLLSIVMKIQKSKTGTLVVMPSHRDVRTFHSNLSEVGIESLILSDLNLLPFESAEPMKDDLAMRMEALHGILSGKIVIADIMAVLKKTSPAEFIKDGLRFSTGGTIPSDITKMLFEWGYTRTFTVRSVGEFSIRGNIIDIFSPVQGAIRIDTFDRDIESIKIFDPQTQISLKSIEFATIFPAAEFRHDEESFEMAKERLKGHPELIENLQNLYGMVGLFWKNSQCALDLLPRDEYLVIYEVEECKKYFEDYEKELKDIYGDLRLVKSFAYSDIERIDGNKKIVYVSLNPLKIPLDNATELKAGMAPYSVERITSQNAYDYIQEIEINEPIVHEDHGIGIYRGTEIIEDADGMHEYLKIEYKNGAILYTPIEKFTKISKYVGSNFVLSDINGKEWKSLKEKARKDIEDQVRELIELYAMREESKGFSFMPQTELEEAFSKSFGYLETPDQMKAIQEVFEDMESSRPMDRLVCGDSGFGKTEVAMRAAFRAVANGKQVVLLAPTMILARQHFENFKKRMEPFGIKVDLIYSQTTESERKRMIDSIANGKSDIIIGTHALLSKKIFFKDIGLLIIDEEQRFGAKQKEYLKSLKLNVDVLTLSATPIPRTLYMALSGIKAISVISTPPIGRVPPHIYITRWNEKIVTMAVLKEINRGGQVFYIHNRIEDMEKIVEKLKRMLPSVTIATVHGKMAKREFEENVNGFYTGRIDMLVSTSVVENGVDVPNANTLIVDDVERYGMAQLYQIKGRVGRSSKKSYIYLMYTKEPGEAVMRRLKAIEEFNEFGSSLNLSLKDLEIRGSGEVLGLKQHGHIDAIGLQMYKEILEDTIKKMRGEKVENRNCDPDISLPSSILPQDYIEDTIERMKIYRRLASAKNVEEVERIKYEVIDRFGKIPDHVETLFVHSKIKALLCDLKIAKINSNGESVEIIFSDKDSLMNFSKFTKTYSLNLKKNGMILTGVIKNGKIEKLLNLLIEYKKHLEQKEGVA
ncbi:MAG: hypothetical protein C0176_05260 [Mesoaciditoga sp.]|nr:MAG: hypothetical protein C0176_05260 [Mesoaciditoga sp.]HEU24982.1 DEAD/DEAH box helicase [Mesoaciditoga lauensis]